MLWTVSSHSVQSTSCKLHLRNVCKHNYYSLGSRLRYTVLCWTVEAEHSVASRNLGLPPLPTSLKPWNTTLSPLPLLCPYWVPYWKHRHTIQKGGVRMLIDVRCSLVLRHHSACITFWLVVCTWGEAGIKASYEVKGRGRGIGIRVMRWE